MSSVVVVVGPGVDLGAPPFQVGEVSTCVTNWSIKARQRAWRFMILANEETPGCEACTSTGRREWAFGEREVLARSNSPRIMTKRIAGAEHRQARLGTRRMLLAPVSCERGYALCSLSRYENGKRERRSMK